MLQHSLCGSQDSNPHSRTHCRAKLIQCITNSADSTLFHPNTIQILSPPPSPHHSAGKHNLCLCCGTETFCWKIFNGCISVVKKGIFITELEVLCLAVKSVSAILCVQDNTRFTNNNNIVMFLKNSWEVIKQKCNIFSNFANIDFVFQLLQYISTN